MGSENARVAERRGYVKIADAVVEEPWPNDVLAALIRLAAYLNRRWKNEKKSAGEGGRAAITNTTLQTITGKRRADVARKSAERLADFVSISVRHDGDVTLIEWPKFASFQGYADRDRAESRPNLPPSASASASASADAPRNVSRRSPQPSENEPTTRARASKRRARPTAAPDDLEADDKRKLHAWANESEPWAVPHLRELVDACLGHFRAKGQSRASWYQTAQNWIKNERRERRAFYRAVTEPQGDKSDGRRRDDALAAGERYAKRHGLLGYGESRTDRANGGEAVRDVPGGGEAKPRPGNRGLRRGSS